MSPRVPSSVRPAPFVALVALIALAAQGEAQRKPVTSPASAAARIDTAQYAQLKYRHIGPEGNRVTSVAGVTGDPNVYYAGAASGGLWKSVDAGIHWAPIFDRQPVSSIGAIAVAPSDANVVWVGTGEPFIRSNISIGWGVFKSTDAGQNWTKMGLDATGRIARVVIHPTNPDIVFVAALGHAYGPQPERGIFKTTDGGKTWERILFVNDSTGASDLVMDPNNPRILYAAFWQVEIHTWGRESGGAGSSIWKSTDGGATWKKLGGPGFPARHLGKIGLGMSKANSNRLYALIETGDGVPMKGQETDKGRLFRSDDGGTAWQLVSSDRQVAGRTHYYNRMGVSPDNPDEAYFLTASWAKTLDGGTTIIDPPFPEVPGGDHHDIWIDPANGNRMAVSHDGGISITTNRTKSWLRVELPIAQIYHVTVDNLVPYTVCGNRQDGPSACGPSNSRYGGFLGTGIIPRGAWFTVGGGESGWATPDPEDPNLIWSSASGYGSMGGIVTTFDRRTGIARAAEVWPQMTVGWPAADVKYRFVWTFPLTISPHDHHTVYVGSQHVHQTKNGGRDWAVISPDLTRNDKSRQGISGGLTPDNIGVEYSGVVFAIAESPLEKGLLWAGTNDGLVHVSRDGGKNWANVTANIPAMPFWGTVSNIEPSRYDAGTAYLTVDGHQANNRDPWVYKTTDYGRTWTLIVRGIPKTPLSYAHVVREDPVTKGLLYLGLENGLWVSFNDGADWQPLQNNLPHAPVYWLTIQEHFSDLVIATYGRGFWILDDITPLRALAAVQGKDAALLAPRAAYRFRDVEAPYMEGEDPVNGEGPHYGAFLHFWLKTDAKDSVALRIHDSTGALVRTVKSAGKAGLNRTWWDFQWEPTTQAKSRTSPLFSSWVRAEAAGQNSPAVGRFAMLAAPGTYTVRMTVNGQEESQPLVVRKDPNSGASEAEIAEQQRLLRPIIADANATVEMINGLESVRTQLKTLIAVSGDSTMAGVKALADSLEQRMVAVEEQLFQMRVTGRGQDLLRWPAQLAEQLLYLARSVQGSDYAPTTPQREVQQVLRKK